MLSRPLCKASNQPLPTSAGNTHCQQKFHQQNHVPMTNEEQQLRHSHGVTRFGIPTAVTMCLAMSSNIIAFRVVKLKGQLTPILNLFSVCFNNTSTLRVSVLELKFA